jgi:hypothetical protein
MAINLNGYRITVLCEDKNQYDFISSYAKLLGATKLIGLPKPTIMELY